MAKSINMPKLSDEMTEGKLADWLKNEGDEVKAGEVVAQVETEKATLDIEAFESGVLIGIVVNKGDTVPVGRPIAWLGKRGEKVPEAQPTGAPDAAKERKAGAEVSHQSTQPAKPASKPVRAEPQPVRAEPVEAPAAAAPGRSPLPPGEGQGEGGRQTRDLLPPPSPSGRGKGEGGLHEIPLSGAIQAPRESVARELRARGRVPASPAARKAARERGLDLASVPASGPGGRVVLADLERAPAPAALAPAAPARKKRELPPRRELREESIPLSPMRKAIARNLAESKPGAPHFYLETSVDMRRAVALREQLNELGEGEVSVNDVILKACAEALRRHPEVNAAWGGEALIHRGTVDLGMAVAVEDGLLTPVLRQADRKDIFELAREAKELAGRARAKRLKPEEYRGASFTVSNLGMFGIEAFYAVINPPEGAILAVGAVQKVPWVDDAGALVAMERCRLGLSCDHRVIDGATGARFLQTLRAILEAPVRLVMP